MSGSIAESDFFFYLSEIYLEVTTIIYNFAA